MVLLSARPSPVVRNRAFKGRPRVSASSKCLSKLSVDGFDAVEPVMLTAKMTESVSELLSMSVAPQDCGNLAMDGRWSIDSPARRPAQRTGTLLDRLVSICE